MPNQRSIAKALGLTQATVSMALRGDRAISAETRARVIKMAKQMDYHPNPMVTSLMERIRTGRARKDLGCIAILMDAESTEDWLCPRGPHTFTYEEQLAGYRNQAQLRGFRTECFYLREKGASDKTIDRLLFSRGVQGVILAAPKRNEDRTIDFRWDRYALSTVSYTWRLPKVHRVSSHHRHAVDVTFKSALDRGYQRIGICLPRQAVEGVASNWIAGYLVGQSHVPKSRRLEPFLGSIYDTDSRVFLRWYKRWKPDVIISLLGAEKAWLDAEGISMPDELAMVCLNRPASEPSFSGINENNLMVGSIAADLVIDQLVCNKRGLPEHPTTTLVEGSWFEGTSFPVKGAPINPL